MKPAPPVTSICMEFLFPCLVGMCWLAFARRAFGTAVADGEEAPSAAFLHATSVAVCGQFSARPIIPFKRPRKKRESALAR